MNKFVRYDKMSKKNQKLYNNSNRRFFNKNICTVPFTSIKDYNRSNNRYIIEEELYEEDEGDDFFEPYK